MKISLRWKSACAAVSTIALMNIPALAPQAQAAPDWCMQWGLWSCEAYVMWSPEWQECFDYWSTDGCPPTQNPGGLVGPPVGLGPKAVELIHV